MTRDRYPMIEELRRRFGAHKRRWGRYPRSWTLSPARFSRLRTDATRMNPSLAKDQIGEHMLFIAGVVVNRRATQLSFRTSIPAEHWRHQQ